MTTTTSQQIAATIDLDSTVVRPTSATLLHACKHMTDDELAHLIRSISRCRLLNQISGAIPRSRPLAHRLQKLR